MHKINTENIYKYLQPGKIKADLRNIGAFSKITKSWRALKSPRLVKNQRDWKKLAARLLFRLGGISGC
jgi:hypothetical protein